MRLSGFPAFYFLEKAYEGSCYDVPAASVPFDFDIKKINP